MANHSDPAGRYLANGAGAAAILASGIGCGALGIFELLSDRYKGIANFFSFYQPTGPLSGVTISALVTWLAVWFVLVNIWDGREVALARISLIAFVLLALGFALTFPPFMYLMHGK